MAGKRLKNGLDECWVNAIVGLTMTAAQLRPILNRVWGCAVVVWWWE
jgi:hypothetical protein